MPPTVNTLYKFANGHKYKSEAARNYETEVWVLCHGLQKLEGDIAMRLDFYFARDRDIDSSLKTLLDSLQDRLYKNDSQIQTLTITKKADKERPRVELQIGHLEKK